MILNICNTSYKIIIWYYGWVGSALKMSPTVKDKFTVLSMSQNNTYIHGHIYNERINGPYNCSSCPHSAEFFNIESLCYYHYTTAQQDITLSRETLLWKIPTWSDWLTLLNAHITWTLECMTQSEDSSLDLLRASIGMITVTNNSLSVHKV